MEKYLNYYQIYRTGFTSDYWSAEWPEDDFKKFLEHNGFYEFYDTIGDDNFKMEIYRNKKESTFFVSIDYQERWNGIYIENVIHLMHFLKEYAPLFKANIFRDEDENDEES